MLTGTQLATAITAVLIGAVVLGWFLHWIWMRLSNAAITDTARITEMVNKLHESDRAREAANDARELAENLLASREAEMGNRMTVMQTRLDGALEGREADLVRQLREAQADSEASMSGLRTARARVMDLEVEIEALERRLAKAEMAGHGVAPTVPDPEPEPAPEETTIEIAEQESVEEPETPQAQLDLPTPDAKKAKSRAKEA